MPQSLANVLIHIIFSTKNRYPFIDPGIENELYPYLATACRTCHCPAHQDRGDRGSCPHRLFPGANGEHRKAPRRNQDLTPHVGSSPKGRAIPGFAWQGGYGAFSISQSQLESLKTYIENQREHHRVRTFQEVVSRASSRNTRSSTTSVTCGTED